MTLLELTGHESGIVVYPDGEVLVANWLGYGDDCLPVVSPFGDTMSWHEDDGIIADYKQKETEDVRDFLPGTVWDTENGPQTNMEIIYDRHGDIYDLFTKADEEKSGTVYTLSNGVKIVTIATWN